MHQRTWLSRAFGRAAEDVEIDFDRGDRPALVTALLAACAEPADAGYWWRRPVSERTATLLALSCIGEDRASLTLTLRCVATDCGERLEIDLPMAQLAAPAQGSETVSIERGGGDPLCLRRPTGQDLLAWCDLPPASPDQARAAMLAGLHVSGAWRPEEAALVAEALAQADPLVAFAVSCTCPACGHEAEHDVDLEGLALERLAQRQHALLNEVHRLASRYGWTEGEILAVAPARRARYLELIEDGAA